MHIELIDTKLVHSSLSVQRTHACLAEAEGNRKATWECVRKCRGTGNLEYQSIKGAECSRRGDTGDWGNACLHWLPWRLGRAVWVLPACLPLTDIPSGLRELRLEYLEGTWAERDMILRISNQAKEGKDQTTG